MILARADRELRELVGELRDDAAVAKRLGMELDGLIEAAEGRTERLFWTVAIPTSTRGRRRTARWRAHGFTRRCAPPSAAAGRQRCPSDWSVRGI